MASCPCCQAAPGHVQSPRALSCPAPLLSGPDEEFGDPQGLRSALLLQSLGFGCCLVSSTLLPQKSPLLSAFT